MSYITLDMISGILTGSITSIPINFDKVTVEPYQDGFDNDGGFKDISFD